METIEAIRDILLKVLIGIVVVVAAFGILAWLSERSSESSQPRRRRMRHRAAPPRGDAPDPLDSQDGSRRGFLTLFVDAFHLVWLHLRAIFTSQFSTRNDHSHKPTFRGPVTWIAQAVEGLLFTSIVGGALYMWLPVPFFAWALLCGGIGVVVLWRLAGRTFELPPYYEAIPLVFGTPVPDFKYANGKNSLLFGLSVVSEFVGTRPFEMKGKNGLKVYARDKLTEHEQRTQKRGKRARSADDPEEQTRSDRFIPLNFDIEAPWRIVDLYKSISVNMGGEIDRVLEEGGLTDVPAEKRFERAVEITLPPAIRSGLNNLCRRYTYVEIMNMSNAEIIRAIRGQENESDRSGNATLFTRICDSWGIHVDLGIELANFSEQMEADMQLAAREAVQRDQNLVELGTLNMMSREIKRKNPGVSDEYAVNLAAAILERSQRIEIVHTDATSPVERAADTLAARVSVRAESNTGDNPRRDRRRE